MNDLIERYIYDVTRRLPEKERDEIKRELQASITDMLPDAPMEQDVIDVLTKLGTPSLLAEQYRQNPQYLISPAMYELYISVLKTVVATVAGIFACIGAVTVTLPNSIVEIVVSAINAAISGGFQAVFWVTFGFIISERCKGEEKPWTVGSLPQVPDPNGAKISRSSSVAGMIISAFLTVWITIMIVNNEWLFVFVRNSEVIAPFSQTALDRSVPYVLLLGGITLLVNGLKLFWAKWNPSLCVANIISNIVWVCVVIYILHWPDLLSDEFTTFTNLISKDYGHILPGGMTVFFSGVFIITGAIDIGESVWKTWKGIKKPIDL